MLSICNDLINAIDTDSVPEVDQLLQNSEVWNIDNYRTQGEEDYMIPHPLGAAIEECESSNIAKVCQLLIDQKFMLNTALPGGWRPVIGAIQHGNLKVLSLLIESGADVNWPAPTVDIGFSSLSAVCSRMKRLPLEQALEMIELLHSHGAEINPSDGTTPLHAAMTFVGEAGENGIAVMRKLIELGADVNRSARVPGFGKPQSSNHFGTPLHAYYGSGPEAVSLLLHAGADPSIKNNCNEDALTYIADSITDSNEKNGAAVLELLRNHTFDNESRDNASLVSKLLRIFNRTKES